MAFLEQMLLALTAVVIGITRHQIERAALWLYGHLARRLQSSSRVRRAVFRGSWVLLIFTGYALVHEHRVSVTSFGPPVAFAARLKKTIDGKQRDVYRARIVKVGEQARSWDGYFALNGTGESLPTLKSRGHEAGAKKLPTITTIEMKKPGKEPGERHLVCIQQVAPRALGLPYAMLREVSDSSFAIYEPIGGGEDLRRVRPDTINDIELHHAAIDLNGIATTSFESSTRLWFLGYDGWLYRHDVDEHAGASTILGRGPLEQEVTPIVLEYVGRLTALPGCADLSQGWQGLEVLRGPVDGTVEFLATNGRARQLVVFRAFVSDDSVELIGQSPIPDFASLSWDEAASVLHLESADGSPHVVCLLTDAASGEVMSDQPVRLADERVVPTSRADWKIKDPTGDRAYVEGVAADARGHGRAYVSDRYGAVHYRPCAHSSLGDEQVSPLCRINRLLGDGTLLLRPTVSHLQDLACDAEGRLWIADATHFRVIHPDIFGFPYRVSSWVRRWCPWFLTLGVAGIALCSRRLRG